jgi:hypothetical protein
MRRPEVLLASPYWDPALVKVAAHPTECCGQVWPALRSQGCRRYESSHDVVEQKLQPEDRRSQIIGESIRLAIQPVPAADQALERQ